MYSGDEFYGDEVTSPQAGDVARVGGARCKGAAAVIAAAKRDRFGMLTAGELAIVASDPHWRLTPCLVRCGACRFIAGAQDVKHLIACVEAGGDYVRDVSVYEPAKR